MCFIVVVVKYCDDCDGFFIVVFDDFKTFEDVIGFIDFFGVVDVDDVEWFDDDFDDVFDV